MARNTLGIDLLHHVLPTVYKTMIAICDDERFFRNSIINAIGSYPNMHCLDITKDEYICGEDLLNSKKKYNIVFLDYKMSGLNGLETAKLLREKDKDCTIIFLTGFPSFVYESFEVGTFRFFEKPLDVEKLHKALDDFLTVYKNDYPLTLNLGRVTRNIQSSEIMFIEADNKKCYITLAEEILHCAIPMSSIGNLLPKDIFYKVHKAFIANFNQIRNYDKEYIYFTNGKSIPVSRKNFAEFKDAYRNFIKSKVFI